MMGFGLIVRYLYRRLLLGWHPFRVYNNKSKEWWKIKDRKGNIQWTHRLFKSYKEARRYIMTADNAFLTV